MLTRDARLCLLFAAGMYEGLTGVAGSAGERGGLTERSVSEVGVEKEGAV